ncbi:major facilitator superfamily domain-containing protein [Phycomyces blakesleeanus]|uniref:Major facilitator superfamily domain-containing protein n=1 Tax=Phycomyces blakesleeanus TaxID=4837 RepID=A0ABR3BG91_PHYBL
MQMLILTIILISEPMTSAILFPFIYFMIKDFHLSDDEMVIGSYAGWITSIFFIGQLFSAIPWGRCSDQHGRRPVLLTGLIGNAVSTFAFGLSKNLWWAIASRAICGIMNGNTAVARSMLAEITDETNRPFAFSIFGFCWGIGLIGGFLCNPVEQFPSLFGDSEFFKYYPYLLPCIVSALFTLSGWIIGYFYLKESNPSVLARKYNDQKLKDDQKTPNVADEQTKLLGTSKQTFYDGGSPIKSNSLSIASEEEMVTAKAQGSSLSRITRQSYAAIVCYTLWGFQCMAFEEVIPLFYSTPLSAGGLGMDPQEIAKIFAICGIQQTFSQFIVYPMLNRAYSTLTCARLALIVFVPIYMIFPELSPLKVWMFSHTENENMWQWAFYISFMVLLFIRYTGSTTSHVSYMVLVSNSADPEIIGTVNG